MSGLPSPRLSDIFYRDEMFSEANSILSPVAFKALILIVSSLAAQRVWTYSEPTDDPHLPDSNVRLARVGGCLNEAEFEAVRPEIERFFVIKDGAWRLNRAWIVIAPSGRNLGHRVGRDLRAEVFARDGHRCSYCGGTEQPFQLDHIVPVSKGGETSLANLTVACRPCNLSKGDKTVAEWRQE